MPQNDITVSYVVTVYNKENYIGTTVDSLLTQEGDIPSEYIFVDDVSSDRSLEVIEAHTKNISNVTIIRNTTNAGPSIRLNQGVKLARGKYVQFIDSDDVLAANATRVMLDLIEKHHADVVHGGWEKTGKENTSLLGTRINPDAPYDVSEIPLSFVLGQRVRRMSQMVRRDVYIAAGGCDERIFIQDESLALRLASASKRFILLHAPVLLIPKVEGALSRNIAQMNHDRLLANCHLLEDHPELEESVSRQLYERCLSAVWKQKRRMQGMRALCDPLFWRYVHSKILNVSVDASYLHKMKKFFASIDGVRRVAGA